MNCPLCANILTNKIDEDYYDCSNCRGLVKEANLYPEPVTEKERYLEHNNDIEDVRYQKFTSPITNYILETFDPNDQGLDFGSGTGPVISKMLQGAGYNVRQYDPFFANYPELLENKYHYIFACEVVEHFYYPNREFQKLHSMLLENGALAIMTLLYEENINFIDWYYRKDPTHVFIYRPETMNYIAEKYGFSEVLIRDRLTVLRK